MNKPFSFLLVHRRITPLGEISQFSIFEPRSEVPFVTLFVCRTEKNQPELEIQTAVFILHSRLRLPSQKPKAWSEPLPWQCQS